MKAIIKNSHGTELLVHLIKENMGIAEFTIEYMKDENVMPLRFGGNYLDYSGGPFLAVNTMFARIIEKDNDKIYIITGFEAAEKAGKYKIMTKILCDEPLIYINKNNDVEETNKTRIGTHEGTGVDANIEETSPCIRIQKLKI